MAQPGHGTRLYLADALTAHLKVLPHLLKGQRSVTVQSEPHPHHFPLAVIKAVKDLEHRSPRSRRVATSAGFSASVSGIRSASTASWSSPIGESRDKRMSLSWARPSRSCTRSTRTADRSAIWASVSDSSSSWWSSRWAHRTRFMASTMCTGILMVRTWSAIDRVIDCRGLVNHRCPFLSSR